MWALEGGTLDFLGFILFDHLFISVKERLETCLRCYFPQRLPGGYYMHSSLTFIAFSHVTVLQKNKNG